MSKDDVMQIKVDGHPVGIIGLKDMMVQLSSECADGPDEKIKGELLNRLSVKNYIPDRVKERYAVAFLREFKKFRGQPFEEEVARGLEIKVLGPGCNQCDQLEQDLMSVLSELNISGNIDHVRDIKEIGTYGVMGMPALIINGRVKAVGKVPPKNKLIEWLKDAQDK